MWAYWKSGKFSWVPASKCQKKNCKQEKKNFFWINSRENSKARLCIAKQLWLSNFLGDWGALGILS